jgi:hypothetical protein
MKFNTSVEAVKVLGGLVKLKPAALCNPTHITEQTSVPVLCFIRCLHLGYRYSKNCLKQKPVFIRKFLWVWEYSSDYIASGNKNNGLINREKCDSIFIVLCLYICTAWNLAARELACHRLEKIKSNCQKYVRVLKWILETVKMKARKETENVLLSNSVVYICGINF